MIWFMRERGAKKTPALLIEDDDLFRLIFRTRMKREDLEFETAASLKEAVNLDIDPDVIFSDIMLPDSYSVDDLEILKSRFPKSKIIAISAVSTPPERKSYIDRFMEKTPRVVDNMIQELRGVSFVH